MNTGFDIAASTYDKDFTHSHVGGLQRTQVWKLLDEVSNHGKTLNILELNCGTGEDAIRLAKQGNNVMTSDVSDGMLEMAKRKKESLMVNFQRIDLNEIESFDFESSFDLVFSNFGGLNCIDPATMSTVNLTISKLLNPGGKFIAIIMPKFCLWETVYFLIKRNIKEAFRRRKKFVMANISGNNIKTWYYSPENHSSLMPECLIVEKVRPIGLFTPPSYLESFFSKRLNLMKVLQELEKYAAIFSWQAKIADHYYIQYSIK